MNYFPKLHVANSIHHTRHNVSGMVATLHDPKGRYTLGDKLLQQVAATDHSVCTGRETSCSNKVRRHVAATNRFVWTGEFFVKILVSTTEFCRCNKSQKNQIRLNLCDLLRRQILLQRQRFLQKFSSTH